MFQTPEPVMGTVIIMLCSLFCAPVLTSVSHQSLWATATYCWKGGNWGLSGCQSVLPLAKGTPGEHWVTQTCILMPDVWTHLQGFHSCPLNFQCTYLKHSCSMVTQGLGHQGRFNHFIDNFIVWCHDTHVFWKNEKMRDASNLIFLYESDLLKGLNGHLSPEKFCQPSAGGISPELLRSQVTWVVQPSIICLRMDVGEMCI